MKYTYELNEAVRTPLNFNKFKKTSPLCRVFSAMAEGSYLSDTGLKESEINAAVAYIKGLGERAANDDSTAKIELNAIRREILELPMLESIKLLSVFGTYKHVGFDETIEREVPKLGGEFSRMQANNGDVVFPVKAVTRYTVPSETISAGYAIDYRRIANGDMTLENAGMATVKTDMYNRALLYIVNTVYKAIHNATGVKYNLEANGITQAGVDSLLKKVRRYGKPTIIGDYSITSQFNGWVGYENTVNSTSITGVSQKALDEIAQDGQVSSYKGAIVAEMKNPYNEYELNADGTDFKTLLPEGLALVTPAGAKSPIATWSRGGLTTFSGNNVHTGMVETRFDFEFACDVAKGQEHKVGLIYDKNIGGLDA